MKEHLAKLFSYVHSDDEDTVWVKYKNDVSAKGSSNIFLGILYISPSAPNADKTQKPLETVASFQAKGEVLISGDFNARNKNTQLHLTNLTLYLG